MAAGYNPYFTFRKEQVEQFGNTFFLIRIISNNDNSLHAYLLEFMRAFAEKASTLIPKTLEFFRYSRATGWFPRG